MDSVSKGIQSFFRADQADPLYVSLSGRLFPDMAPQGTPMPYCNMSFLSEIPSYDLDDLATEGYMVQFDLYSEGGRQAERRALELIRLFKNKFDNCTFPVIGYELVRFRRKMAHKIGEDGNKRIIFQYSAEIGEI